METLGQRVRTYVQQQHRPQEQHGSTALAPGVTSDSPASDHEDLYNGCRNRTHSKVTQHARRWSKDCERNCSCLTTHELLCHRTRLLVQQYHRTRTLAPCLPPVQAKEQHDSIGFPVAAALEEISRGLGVGGHVEPVVLFRR